MSLPYPSLSDKELLTLLSSGDRIAFDEIYERYSDYLYQFAFNILEDQDECQDAIQDVFVWLWDNRYTLDITYIKTYLGAAVKYRLTRSIQRSRHREEILAKHELDPYNATTENDLELKELQNLINRLICQLPDRAREIFQLSRHSYLSNKEIAQKLGISEKTVENQITIALKKLHQGLGKLKVWLLFL